MSAIPVICKNAFWLLIVMVTCTICVLCNHSSSKQRPITRPLDYISQSRRNGKKPNIVLFLTDDQDVELGSLDFMPKTLKHIREHGAEFRHAYVTTPMCCPSRSSLLTGMYVHNHQVFTNKDNCSSTQWQATHEKKTFATYLSNAGYRTGYFGKYLNKYNGTYIPPGWREWGGLIMNSKYYNYSINMNGKKIKHGFSYDKDYYTDLIANDSITFLRNSKKQFPNKPLMLTMAFPAPHGPEDSAPQYSDLFFNISTHHTPSYDYAPNLDKQWILQVTNKMQPIHRQFTDLLMTKRLQTLQSVDVAVEQVINELKQLGELDNTYIIYTSDHGYHLGQFGLIKGKSFPFEFDVRVPFLIRGPGIVPGSTLNEIVLNIDLAPTFLHMAGVDPPSNMDGRSIMPLFLLPKKKKRIKWPDTFLIESSGRRETPYLDNKQLQTNLLQYSLPVGQMPLKTNSTYTYKTTTIKTTTDINTEIINSSDIKTPETTNNTSNISRPDDYDYNESNSSIAESTEREIIHPDKTNLALRTQRCLMEARQLCRNGSKRNCQLEKYKLRKQRCRLNQEITPTPTKADKNCICFTSNGLIIYKSSSEIHRSRDGLNQTLTELRHKPTISPTLLKQLTGRRFRNRSRRIKRNSLMKAENNKPLPNHIEDLMEDNKYLSNNTQIPESNEIAKILPECTIHKGHVKCSEALYQNKRTWQKSRYQIEGEISFLKRKLENLKHIKKYLKITKPKRKSHGGAEQINEFKGEQYRANVKRTEKIRETGQENNIFNVLKNPHRHHHHLDEISRENTDSNEKYNRFETFRKSLNQEKQKHRQNCYCEDDENTHLRTDEEIIHQTKEDKKRMRKQKKKDEECHFERMTCFEHNNDHWRTEPRWNAGTFCFCMNANNNTYSCLRTINATHNFLYCEFTTGLITFYNLRIDPFELHNRFHQLKTSEKAYLKDLLKKMVACKGGGCTQHLESNNIRF
ncbi:extracellular sulfatase Sulf1 isoform X3 [Rhynchophorus ferrugineus]|uniref:extracellular sulfatase Sulf1 isoform X3 n=1 Tax=Rhynchophorus ferrugineus TaxID=354439 RepID=UPI003FCCECD7